MRAVKGWSVWSSGLSCDASISSAGKSIKALARRDGVESRTRSGGRSVARRRRATGGRRAGSSLEPFKPEIHRLLGEDPKLPGSRVRELLEPLGCDGGKTVVDDYLREVRPLFSPPRRTFQRTVYRPGRDLPVRSLAAPRARSRSGTARRGWGGSWSRAWAIRGPGAGALVFSKQTAGSAGRDRGAVWAVWARCRRRWSGTASPGCTPAAGARRTRSPRSAGSCRSAGGSASQPTRRPRARSSGCRAIWRRTSSPAAGSPTSSTSRTNSTPGS